MKRWSVRLAITIAASTLVACGAAPGDEQAREDIAELRREQERLMARLTAVEGQLKANTLLRPGEEADPAALVASLSEGDLVKRYRTGRALAALGAVAVPHLVAAIEESPDTRQAKNAALVLSQMKDPAAAESLIGIYRTSDSATTRCAVLLSFRQGAAGEAFPLVLEGLADSRAQVRLAAARAAGRLRLLDSAPSLVDMFMKGGAEEQRAALRALERLGGSSSSHVAERYHEATPGERLRLLQVLELTGGKAALALARIALGDPLPEVRLAGAHVLAKHGSDEGEEVARQLFQTPPNARIEQAARLLLERIEKMPRKH